MQFQVVARVVAVWLLLAVGSLAHAQTQPTLRWADIEAAIDRHPAMLLAADQLAMAEADIGLSRQYPNPELGASIGQGQLLDGSETALIWGIELTIPIDAPGAYLNETQAAQAGHEAARHEAVARRLEIVRQLKGLFFQIAIGQELLRVRGENLEQLTRLVDIARLRVQQGEARPMEATRPEIELEKLQAEVEATASRLTAARATLDLWLGGKLPEDFEVETDWRSLPVIPALDDVIAQARSRHPALLAAGRRVVASEARLRAQRHGLFPDISLGGFYDRELDAHNYGGLVTIELPLWNWNSGGVARARAEQSAARHERDLAESDLVAAIRQAHRAASQAIATARRYSERVLPMVRQTSEALDAMYRVGETDIIDVLDSRRNLIETETDMLAACEEGWLAYLDLVALMGGDHD